MTAPAFVSWVGSLGLGDVPEVVDRQARTALLHHVLCGANGQQYPVVSAVASAVPGDAPEDVAFRDAVAGHSTLQEDVHVPSVSHLGTVVWPTALALAGTTPDLTVRALVTAAAAGYEVAGRVGQAIASQGLAARARPTGVFGPLASWAVASKLCGLTPDLSASALGLAANASAGLNGWAWQGGQEVYVHSGQAAAAGIRAAAMAVQGVAGSPDVLFGRQGYVETLGGDTAATRLARTPWAGCGGPWVVEELVFKGHPACNYVQTVIDLVEGLGPDLMPAAGAAITVEVTSPAARYPGCDNPPPWTDLLQVQMSIQFAVGAALTGEGYAAVLAAGPSRWAEVAEVGARVSVKTAPDLDRGYPERQGARIRFTTEDGGQQRAELADLVGLDGDGVRLRLRAMAAGIGASDVAEQLIAAVDDHEGDASAAQVAMLVRRLWAASAATAVAAEDLVRDLTSAEGSIWT